MDDIKRIDIAEFRALGFLQEVNRRVLHPCGLALEVEVDDDGTERLGGVWDYRDDPEGITYVDDGVEQAKVASVDAEIAKHRDARVALLGSVVQS